MVFHDTTQFGIWESPNEFTSIRIFKLNGSQYCSYLIGKQVIHHILNFKILTGNTLMSRFHVGFDIELPLVSKPTVELRLAIQKYHLGI